MSNPNFCLVVEGGGGIQFDRRRNDGEIARKRLVGVVDAEPGIIVGETDSLGKLKNRLHAELLACNTNVHLTFGDRGQTFCQRHLFHEAENLGRDFSDRAFVGGPGCRPNWIKSTCRVSLTNKSIHQIRVIGSKMSCSCTTVNEIPQVFAPGKKTNLSLTIAPGLESNEFHETIKLFVDDLDVRQLTLTFHGQAQKP